MAGGKAQKNLVLIVGGIALLLLGSRILSRPSLLDGLGLRPCLVMLRQKVMSREYTSL